MKRQLGTIEDLEVLPQSGRELQLAAAMLQFPSRYADVGAVMEQDAATWRRMLAPIQAEGFSALELSNTWLDIADLDAGTLDELRGVFATLELCVAGCLIARRSIASPARGEVNFAYTAKLIKAASRLGADIVCLGLHEIDPLQPGASLWFWNGAPQPSQVDVRDIVVERLRELSAIAEDYGILISLETYPGTLVGTTRDALDLYNDVDHPAFGLNPDLGNFVRVQGRTEDWRLMAASLLPVSNYWHVKNYVRLETTDGAQILSHPAPLDNGVVDYRKCLNFALYQSFSGPIVFEHYGGDGLSLARQGHNYFRRMLSMHDVK